MKIRIAVSPHGGALGHDALIGFVDALEPSGFDGIWLSDLPLGPVLDPRLGLALAAGRTARLHLGANIVPLGRNPFLLAKELAQLDQLSRGRLLLSFVTGLGQAGERDALGLGSGGRGEALEQALSLIRRWWAGEPVDHVSERWRFTGLAPVTRPVQDPLEVWLGGRGPQALDRVGRVADGWLGAQITPAEAADGRAAIQGAAARAGREIDPEHFGLSIPYAREDPGPEQLAAVMSRRRDVDARALLPVGGRGLRAFLDECIAAGLSKFVVRPVSPVGSWTEEIAWLSEAILDLQT